MPTTEEWINDRVAPDEAAVKAGDGCHPLEGQALGKYLDGKLSSQDAAKYIVAQVLDEQEPQNEIYRVWSLLAEALVELEAEREKLYELVVAIQQLPTDGSISFDSLPGFYAMWSDLYRLHFHGSDQWETSNELLSAERSAELREHFEAVGIVEATMYVRGISKIPATWGYETINLLLSKSTSSLDILMGEIHAWLTRAGEKLHQEFNPEEEKSFSKRNAASRPGAQEPNRQPMSRHWTDWRDTLLEFGSEGSGISESSRKLALECHRIMA